jgi:hypothetical protein
MRQLGRRCLASHGPQGHLQLQGMSGGSLPRPLQEAPAVICGLLQLEIQPQELLRCLHGAPPRDVPHACPALRHRSHGHGPDEASCELAQAVYSSGSLTMPEVLSHFRRFQILGQGPSFPRESPQAVRALHQQFRRDLCPHRESHPQAPSLRCSTSMRNHSEKRWKFLCAVRVHSGRAPIDLNWWADELSWLNWMQEYMFDVAVRWCQWAKYRCTSNAR